ncbi:hypothetical protein DIPPA_22400 [Diplonema papillatum]|nr:hypothetical protein DIPPA_22400 [Diplonema papillatum]
MRAIMVAHECGIPQWHWEVDNKEELLKALRAAQEKAKDISHARAVAAVQETEPSPILKKFAEVVLVVRPTIRNVEETPADEEDIEGTGLPDLENEDPLLGDEAWRMFVRILTKKPTYFTHFSTEAEMVAISLENPRLQEFLDPYITGEVQQAEVVLSEYGINRLNYKSKEGVVKARLMTLQRHNMGTKARKLQQAWSVLVSYGMQKSGGDSMLAEGGGNAEDSDLSDATPEDTQLKPRKQPSNFSFSRPISPSSLVDGSRSRLTGPVRAAFDGIHHMSGASRDIAWFDGMGAEPESREKAEGEADGDSTAVPVDELFEEGTVPPGEPYAAQQNVQEKQAPSLPSLRVLHLQQRPQQEERRPFAVFVDNLANDLSETEESLAKKRAVEIEQKFGSIRICLVEELTHNKANGTVSIQPEEVLPRMQRLRNTMRSQLTNILDYITTLEKTHFNLVASGTYLEQCPGLVHFVLIDRTAHNRVISPLIVPMRAEGIDGFRQFSAELQSATEEGLLPRLRQMFNTAHLLVKKGFTEGLWGDSSMQYYHKIWIESDGDEIAIDQDILSTIQVRPWAIKDHLEALGRKSVKCYELYVMYLGIIPPKAVEDNNKALLSILLPQNDRSNTQSREY